MQIVLHLAYILKNSRTGKDNKNQTENRQFTDDSAEKANKPDFHEQTGSFCKQWKEKSYMLFPTFAENIVRFMLTCLAYSHYYTGEQTFIFKYWPFVSVLSIFSWCSLPVFQAHLLYTTPRKNSLEHSKFKAKWALEVIEIGEEICETFSNWKVLIT